MSLVERDPNKRRVKPVEQACVLDFDEESSDDSDFRIEDHPEASDDDYDDSATGQEDASEEQSESSDDKDEDEEEDDLVAFRNSISNHKVTSVADIIKQAAMHQKFNLDEKSAAQVLICAGCLGDQSDGVNEIVECDGCGVTVHEACYGISDTASLDSTDSLSPTTPWFCEACKAGVKHPVCELCPNSGGVFKETDVGRWVHLVCALYVPGVAFGEVDKLAAVTLFEMPYSKWGAKVCSLCDDARLARTGVCIGCDAGMCRTYFHVTCAQREGYLSEAHSEEVDQADPFYAHCKLHSDTTLVKRRRRNYLALSLRQQLRKRQLEEAWMAVAADGMMADGQQVSAELRRVCRKLDEQKRHYKDRKLLRPPPWVPTQKMPRLLTTSASACRRLLRKAEFVGACPSQWEVAEAHANALADIRRKWHLPPAFSVEFIAYFLDRNDRLRKMRDTAEKLEEENRDLVAEETALRIKYDEVLKCHSDITGKGADLKQTIHRYHSAILSACPNKSLPNVDEIFRKAEVRGKQQASRQIQQPVQMMVPTAAALKMGVGFPLKGQHRPHGMAPSTGMLSGQQAKIDNTTLMLNDCGICRQRRDQHLMAKCDTCRLYYHLGCLNPPLTRLPKKSKLYGWQCSECDKTSDSETEQVKTPRRSRTTGRFKSSSSRGSGGMQADVEPTSLSPSPPRLKIKPMGEANQDKDTPHKSTHHLDRQMSPTSNGVSSTGTENQLQVLLNSSVLSDGVSSHKSAKKRRREKHRNRCANGDGYSPGLEGFPFKEHKRKRKKKSLDLDDELPHPRITIKIKPIPLPAGEVASESNPQRFYVPQEGVEGAALAAGPPVTAAVPRPSRTSKGSTGMKSPPRAGPKATPKKGGGTGETCDVCRGGGNANDSVKCDECQKNYHFSCLDPPLKKSPKKRGYSWHCADCDPTGSE